MSVKNERVLITGGAGFIGAYLARELISAGACVHLLLRPQSNRWRLKGMEDRCTIHWADLRNAADVRRVVESSRPQVIYHLATHGAYSFQKNRSEIFESNVLGTANLLEALDSHDYQALVHAGSSSEYGPKDEPMRPGDLLEPRTDYAVAKCAGTLLCQSEAYRGRPIATVRVFSAYGPWEEPTRLVPYVMSCCFNGEAPQLSPGWQPRDFIFVGDVTELLQRAAHDSRALGRILHAGTGVEHSVRDMVNTIVQVCGAGWIKPALGARPHPSDEPAHWVACRKETTDLLGWEPRHDLRSGIQLTWEWLLARQVYRLAA